MWFRGSRVRAPSVTLAAIAQSVERILGKDEVTSSILVGSSALVAQLDRASDYGSEGYRFESFQARTLRRMI